MKSLQSAAAIGISSTTMGSDDAHAPHGYQSEQCEYPMEIRWSIDGIICRYCYTESKPSYAWPLATLDEMLANVLASVVGERDAGGFTRGMELVSDVSRKIFLNNSINNYIIEYLKAPISSNLKLLSLLSFGPRPFPSRTESFSYFSAIPRPSLSLHSLSPSGRIQF